MALMRNQPDAPHLGRSVLIAPGRRVNLAQAGHPLAAVKPTTRVGSLALDLAMQTSSATIQIVATSSYVAALTGLAAPNIQFASPPPGTQGLTVQELQAAYDTFVQQLAALQGQAQQWIATSGGAGGASIFSTLVDITGTIATLDSTVQSNLNLLPTLDPGTPAYDKLLAKTKQQVSAEAQPLTDMKTQLTTLSGNLDSAATTLTTAATTGVLQQLITAYQDEITALNADIAKCNDAISSDNSKIIGLGFAAGAAIVVGIIGLLNIWNPFGWLLMAGGGVGAYFAITEIETLKAQISGLKGQIQNDNSTLSTDEKAAKAVSMFAQSAQAAATMNSAAQTELNALVQLCGTLASDLDTALSDVNAGDFSDALTEWQEVVQAAAFLNGITAYLWPSTILLQNATGLSATGSTAYLVSNSGLAYSIAAGGNTWTAVDGSSLSIVAGGGAVAGIDGAPLDGSQDQPDDYGQTFLVKTFEASSNTWTTISTFPAAQIAVDDGGHVWAVSQVQADRQAYLYSGSGTVWNPLGAMPNTDAPGDIGAYGGTLFAIANNAGGLWYVTSGGSWTQIGTATYSRLSVNGGWIGLTDTSGNAWVASMQTAGSYTPTATMTSVALLAQAPNGDQYVTDANLNLWHVASSQGGSPVSTQLRTLTVGVAVSDAGTVYATDNNGDVWTLTDLANNAWRQLPALPTS